MNVQDFNPVTLITKIPKPNDDIKQFEWNSLNIYKETVNSYTVRSKTKVKTNGKEYIPSPKDKIYFYPGCDVPRYKVRDWAQKNNASITVIPEKATIKIASEQSKADCYSYDTLVKVNRNQFLKWLDYNYNLGDGNIAVFYKFLEESTENCIYLCNDFTRGMGYHLAYGEHHSGGQTSHNKEMGFKKSLYSFDNGIIMYYYAGYLTDNNKKILESLENDPDVYPQESIIQVINEGATIINQDMYKSLRNMFGSTNKADHIVAIEVMSNCNMAPSLHHLLLLIQQFHSVIYNLKESKHVNFKSLLEYLDLDRHSIFRIDEDRMMTLLMSKDVLTESIMIEFADGVKQLWKQKFDSTHFKINSITVSDEVKDYFKRQAELQTT